MKTEQILEATQEDLVKGYRAIEDHYQCLCCGEKIEIGIIYQKDNIFYEAEKYMKLHIQDEHQSVFNHLISQDKKITGLSLHQRSLLKCFYQGKKDNQICEILGIGSKATVRNHRYVMKEKERQAKIYLAIMEILKKSNVWKEVATDPIIQKSPTEREKIIHKFLPEGITGKLTTFQTKEKNKRIILEELSSLFEYDRTYTEKEINEILKGKYEDFATLRRYLITYGLVDRTPDGREYWLTKKKREQETKMNEERKKELKFMYKESKPKAGVYQIKNIINNKIMILSTPNLKTINGKLMELRNDSFKDKYLQQEWKEYGEDAFKVDILEVLEDSDEEVDRKKELSELKEKWLEKLHPYGEKGYHINR